MKKIILFFALFTFSKTSISQNERILDSLINLSKTVSDTTKANIYTEICQNALQVNSKISVEFANKLIQFGTASSYKKYSVRGYEVIGIYYFIYSNLDSSLFYFEKAKAIASQNKLHQKEGRLYFRMSFIYVAKSNFEKSIELILKAIELEQSTTSKIFLSEYKNKLGSVFLAKKDYVNALKYFNEAIDDDRYNDVVTLGYIYQNLSILANDQNDFQKAFQYLHKSNFYLLKQKEYRAVAVNYNALYIYFSNINQFDSANYYNKKFGKYARMYNMVSDIFSSHLNNFFFNLFY